MKKKSRKKQYLQAASLLMVTGASGVWGGQQAQADTIVEPVSDHVTTATATTTGQASNEVLIPVAGHQEDLASMPMVEEMAPAGEATAPVSEATTAPIHHSPASNQAGSIEISGNTHIGETLTATISDANGVDPSQANYQWYANTKAISGANQANFTLTADEIGKQINVQATYKDWSGYQERVASPYTGAVTTVAAEVMALSASEDLPTVSLEGNSQVKEGDRLIYTVRLSRPADVDLSVDITLLHGETGTEDVSVRHNLKRLIIKKGETSADFRVTSKTDGLVEGKESFEMTINQALAGSVSPNQVSQAEKVEAQSVIIPAYNYPEMWKEDAYWQAIHKAGGSQVPFVIINPRNGSGKAVEANYAKLLNKNKAAGIKSIGYINTLYGSRSLAEVKGEVQNYFDFYGKDMINGFFLDEIGSRTNQQTIYLAEIYNYIKAISSDKLVVANPGAAVTDTIAPYADIFVTSEVSADTYINNYKQPSSAFEHNSSKSKHIMHIIHDASESQYQKIIELSRNRNAGWLFITSDSSVSDNNPYNDLPKNFATLVAQINNLGLPADPHQGIQALPQMAKLGPVSRIRTVIIDADSPMELEPVAARPAGLEVREKEIKPTDTLVNKPVAVAESAENQVSTKEVSVEPARQAELQPAPAPSEPIMMAILASGPAKFEGSVDNMKTTSPEADASAIQAIISPGPSLRVVFDDENSGNKAQSPSSSNKAGHQLPIPFRRPVILTIDKDPWAFSWLSYRTSTDTNQAPKASHSEPVGQVVAPVATPSPSLAQSGSEQGQIVKKTQASLVEIARDADKGLEQTGLGLISLTGLLTLTNLDLLSRKSKKKS